MNKWVNDLRHTNLDSGSGTVSFISVDMQYVGLYCFEWPQNDEIRHIFLV